MENYESKRFSKRSSVPKAIEDSVLTKCRRRCCLCYIFDDNMSVKEGQIAHIDRNRNNNNEDNLVYLCLEHHNQYDSLPSQSKRYTQGELKHYKEILHKVLGTSHTQCRMVIGMDFKDFLSTDIQKVLNIIRKVTNDVDIRITSIGEGSVLINLKSTENTYKKLRIAFENGTLSDALQLPVLAVERIHNPSASSLILLAKELLAKKNVDDSIACINKALEADPDNAFAWSLKSTALLTKLALDKEIDRQQLLNEAHAYVCKIHRINPDNPANWVNNGIIFYESQKIHKALECFYQAIKLNPKYAFAWYNAGIILLKLGKEDKAIKALETAAKYGFEGAQLALTRIRKKRV